MSVVSRALWVRATNILLLCATLLLCVATFEFAGRIYYERTRRMVMVVPETYGVFDDDLGVRYPPNSSHSQSYIARSGVKECLANISITNADGFRGHDTLADYESAEKTIVVTGDSFSHWNNEGMTVPDYTKRELIEYGHDVSVLNVAGGAFGLKHMVVHAAETAQAVKPDLIIIQFITVDITRDWWFLETFGLSATNSRARIARTIEGLDPASSDGDDAYVVDNAATHSWCLGMKGTDEMDVVSSRALRMRDAFVRDVPLLFFWDRVMKRALGFGVYPDIGNLPRITSPADLEDERTARAFAVLTSLDIPILFVHLPTADEILAEAVPLRRIQRTILRFFEENLSLERIPPTDFSAFAGITNFGVSPYEGHPSAEVQAAYGLYVAELVSPALQNE